MGKGQRFQQMVLGDWTAARGSDAGPSPRMRTRGNARWTPDLRRPPALAAAQQAPQGQGVDAAFGVFSAQRFGPVQLVKLLRPQSPPELGPDAGQRPWGHRRLPATLGRLPPPGRNRLEPIPQAFDPSAPLCLLVSCPLSWALRELPACLCHRWEDFSRRAGWEFKSRTSMAS